MIICAVKSNSIVQFITVTLIFIFVLLITYFTTRWIGNYQKKQVSHGNIKIIESMRVSNNKVLEVVKVGDKCFLIAVCKDTITGIGEVNEDSFSSSSSSGGASFGTVFSRFRAFKAKEEAEEESNASESESFDDVFEEHKNDDNTN